jgi:copper(I)-binding protein
VTAGPDEDSIRQLLFSTFDKPQSPLIVEPIVVTGDHAIAGWSQSDMGGRALLRRRQGAWSLILCSGDGIRSSDALRHAGVPSGDDVVLSRRLVEAEHEVAPERLALFAKCEGTLMMDASAGHPQHPQMQQAQMHHPQMQSAEPRTFKVGDIVIEAPWVRATPQGAQVAGGYMKITNTGKETDRLIGGTLDQARRFEVHEMTMDNGVAKMRPLTNGLEIKPGTTVELKPGGYHVMGTGVAGWVLAGPNHKRNAEVREGWDDLRRILGRADRRRSTTGRRTSPVTRYYESLISSKTKVFFCTSTGVRAHRRRMTEVNRTQRERTDYRWF